MTIQKLAQLIEKELAKNKLTPTKRADIINTLTGLALLTDENADPDCVFSNKVNSTLNDLAHDVRAL